jgi:serine/threonine-protein kinase
MTLDVGQTLSHYEILGPLGAGAMGEVYRARDTRLEREVAIKVLPEHFAEDKERLRRFEREAKSLASLNHPNVAQVFGIDQVGDTCFMAMELVPGETLEDRIARGALPIAEAVDVCRQIAEGLEAAHEACVIHRDLKPANVRITPDGKVKVLDFGLAKPTDREVPSASATDSVLSTAEGRLIGTPTYMAPEQARGRPIDRRIDVWAFGCVLFECLSGARAFEGETISDVLASVLEKEPDWTLLPAATPLHVRELAARCLAKNPYERLRDIGDARLEILRARPAEAAAARISRPAVVAAAAFALGTLVVGTIAALWPRAKVEPTSPVRRFSIEGIDLVVDAFEGLALSPDGSRLVYRARGEDGVDRLHLRSLDSYEALVLEGTEYGWLPFFSPDGESIGFYARSRVATISLSGGAVRTIAPLDSGFTGGVWLPDDSIVVGHDGTLSRIPTGGNALERIELDDPEITVVTSPSPLAEERAILCSVRRGEGFEVAVVSLEDGSVRTIARNGFTPMYATTGHVVFQQGTDGPLMALPFDLESLAATGPAFPVPSELGTRISYQARMFSISRDGTLAYIPETAELSHGTLVWVNRTGQSEQITTRPSVIFGPRLSSDDRRIAFRTPAVNCDLWVHDLDRGGTSRLTREGDNHGIAWSPDDRRIFFARQQGPGWAVVASSADGSGKVEQLSEAVIQSGHVSSSSPTGEHLLVSTRRESTGGDVDLFDVKDRSLRPLLASRFEESAASFSHDGRYIAYVSDESGQPEVYVQPFPGLDARTQVSTHGGQEPVWSPRGDALFYRAGGQVMAAAVATDPPFSADRPRALFKDVYARRGAHGLADYDVSQDGERLVMIRERQQDGGGQIRLVLNWFDELLRAAEPRGDG